MARFKDLEAIKAATRADIEAASRRARLVARLAPLRRWAKRWTSLLKAIAGLLSVVGAVFGGAEQAYRGARRIGRFTVKFVAARSVAPAELPKTGIASTALDRVDRPSAPVAQPVAHPGSDPAAR